MYKIDLCHLGNNCEPGILIDKILKNNKKTLFMLGVYGFNNIIPYLKDGCFEDIYKKEYLSIRMNETSVVDHTKYKFGFNHDYKHDNSEITNYDFVKNRFDEKIQNFKTMLTTDTTTIIINFSSNINVMKIVEMMRWFNENKIAVKKILLFIFTYNDFDVSKETIDNVFIIKLQNTFHSWWKMEKSEQFILYQEIYEKFIECCDKVVADHDFPRTFMETGYT
jgi:hypothetical protein